MSPGQIAATDRSGRVHNVVTIRTPVGGAVKMPGVREGMTLATGQTLAELNSHGTVWVNAAIPDAQEGGVRVGAPARRSEERRVGKGCVSMCQYCRSPMH